MELKDKESAIEILSLINEDVYNLNRDSRLIIKELCGVISFLSEEIDDTRFEASLMNNEIELLRGKIENMEYDRHSHYEP